MLILAILLTLAGFAFLALTLVSMHRYSEGRARIQARLDDIMRTPYAPRYPLSASVRERRAETLLRGSSPKARQLGRLIIAGM